MALDIAQKFSQQLRDCAERVNRDGAAAMAELYELTATRLVRLAVNVTRNQHDAEDAVQATLVRVADSPQRLATAEQPWPYLLRMVRNEALVILRARKRSVFSLTLLTDLLTVRRVDEVEIEERHRAIWSALRKLPQEQREVVVLKIWEELTFAQIADVLSISLSTASSRYRYALEKLSHSLSSGRNATLFASPDEAPRGGQPIIRRTL